MSVSDCEVSECMRVSVSESDSDSDSEGECE